MNRTGWTELDTDVAEFVDDYDTRNRIGGAEAVFADSFLALDPARAVTLTPAMLARVLPVRRKMFDDAGVGRLRRTSASQFRLDDRHVLVGIGWSGDRAGSGPVELDSTFLLRREGDRWQIVVYLNHTDLSATLATAEEAS
ncbi:hypothetical protein [Dactylosporangium sp. CA-092794]|uniref:hypothetical protein n=1 Tax=Dactylosporangium sp. CA-092794 TaxID=3239929 RepID=UPI003D945B32